MERKRSAGILLPVFSLPSPYGIGSLGKEARAFVDFLQEAGQEWWQVLPVGPTGAGDSPYAGVSTFAGNPLLIDLEELAAEGLLTAEELASARVPESGPIDYPALYESREHLLRTAFQRGWSKDAEVVEHFTNRNHWVEEYALYLTLKVKFGGTAWTDWPDEALRSHDPAAVEQARQECLEEWKDQVYVQFLFQRQWDALKAYANERGVRLIGDLPMYVSLDSADVWSERKEFLLDESGRPEKVAGVPPDYFSESGQLWGNPLYDWAAQKSDGFGWWIRRVEGASRRFDAIRIDHFRAFESYWAIPAGAESAREGAWEAGPGRSLLEVLTNWFPQIRYIAEDLGLITEAVHQLRLAVDLPGMKVLEFAFSGPDNAYLPHNYSPRCVCYTGTHDNDTVLGWYRAASDQERSFTAEYLGTSEEEGVRTALLRAGQQSVAQLFIAQMQDYLALGSEGRINVPGVPEGNWRWRMESGQLTEALAREIRRLTWCAGRCAAPE